MSFRELIQGCPGRSVVRWCWYQFVRLVCGIWFKLFYRLRVTGRENLPLTGPLLIIANHQSYLDPILIGIATGKRPPHVLARKNLFKPFFIGWLLKSLGGVPVDRGTADIASMRRCIEILKDEMSLAIFPEGTRTEDGQVQPLKPGMLLIAKRGGAMVLPVAIAGSFEAWPRSHKLPRFFGRISVHIGKPIAIEELMKVDEETSLDQLRGVIAGMVGGEGR